MEERTDELYEEMGGEKVAAQVGEALAKVLVARAARNEVLDDMAARVRAWRLDAGWRGADALFFQAPLSSVDTRGITPAGPPRADWRRAAGAALESRLVAGLAAGPSLAPVENRMLDSRAAQKRRQKAAAERSAGDGWFGVVGHEHSRETDADLQLLRMRNHFALPGQYFRKMGRELPDFFQVGVVEEDARDPYHRVAKRDRHASFAEELLADRAAGSRRHKRLELARGNIDEFGAATPQAALNRSRRRKEQAHRERDNKRRRARGAALAEKRRGLAAAGRKHGSAQRSKSKK
jgi:hypothetical protein